MIHSAAHKVGNFHRGEARNDLAKQWIARPADQKFLSLTDLHRSVSARAEASVESRIDTRKIEFLAPEQPRTIEETHHLSVGLQNGAEAHPTHWSFGQLCTLAKAPAGFLRELPSQHVADILEHRMRWSRQNEAVKLYQHGDELLAATGPDYGRIFDRDVVSAVMQVAGDGVGDTRWKVPGTLDWSTNLYDPETPVSLDTTTLYASDRDVFIFLVDDRNPIEVGKLPTGEPDLMFRGFYISNSEVGSASLRLAAFYLRAICMNRMMWGVEGFEEITMRHSKYAPSRFIEESRPALKSFADGTTKRLIEGVEKAKAAKLASDNDEALEFLAKRSFSRKKAAAIIEAVETANEGRPARTAWDFADGITRIAQNEANADNRVALEMEARKILDRVA